MRFWSIHLRADGLPSSFLHPPQLRCGRLMNIIKAYSSTWGPMIKVKDFYTKEGLGGNPRTFMHSFAPRKLKLHFSFSHFQAKMCMPWLGISCEIALKWLSLDLGDGKLTLGQVIAWCFQATSYHPSQCWPRAMSHMAALGQNHYNDVIMGAVASQITSLTIVYSTVD